MEKQKYPEVRFSQFHKSWEVQPLKNIFGKIRNAFVGTATPFYVKKGNFYLESNNVKDGKINKKSQIFIDDYFYLKQRDKWLKTDDLVMVQSGHVGHSAVISEDLNNSAAHALIMFSAYKVQTNPHFLNYQWQTNSAKNAIEKIATGNTIRHILSSDMKEFLSFFSSYDEQSQIGNFFQNLDQSIALQEKKLAQTQNLKKAMLEKMFPKAGSQQPEIRLKGFSGDWDTINLESLCSIGDIDHRMPESTKSGIPYLMTGDFLGINELDFENAKLISNEDYEQLSKKIKPEIGDILFARYASVGTVRLVVTDIKFLISYSCAILKTSVNSNGEYLFYWFQTAFAQNQIEQEINTGSQRNIGIDSLKKLSVRLPKANEQKAIANFFKQLDETLALQQQQLQTLKNLKQAFLEKMFV
ncbi:restriction endonuclease subunit S [Acinetobacter modestus]|uniref:restriction endonuclease subunit S n=1 Tax=Acinetobacter modestus TaxID=1776740 RepID=UPI00301B2D21